MSLPLSTLLGLFVSFGSTNLKQNSNQIRTLTYHVITLLIFFIEYLIQESRRIEFELRELQEKNEFLDRSYFFFLEII